MNLALSSWVLAILGSEKSIDPEDVRDAPDLDFSDALRPLLADTGPALAHAQRLARQKTRMKNIKDDLLRQAEEKKRPLHRKDQAVQPDYLQQLFAIWKHQRCGASERL